MELNTYLIQKLGWTKYSWGIGLSYTPIADFFGNDPLVRFFFIDDSTGMAFIIKEMSPKEKQKTKKLYKFIKFSYLDSNGLPINVKTFSETVTSTQFQITEFSSNHELFRLIIDNGSVESEKYKRHFAINKILR